MKREPINIIWYEIALILIIAVTVARFVWAKELNQLQFDFLTTIGLSKLQINLLLSVIAIFLYVSIFKREKKLANNKGLPVVRRSILIGAGIILVLVVLFFIHLGGGFAL